MLVSREGNIKLTDINIFKNTSYLKGYWSAPEVYKKYIKKKYILTYSSLFLFSFLIFIKQVLNEDKLLFSSDIWSAGIIFLQV